VPFWLMKRLFGMPSLKKELGVKPDGKLFAELYRPPVPHETLPAAEDEFQAHHIKVAGVVVRYDQDRGAIQVTIEGELPQATVDVLMNDLRDKLSELENSPCQAMRL
jgi:hypothetical protein